MKRLRWMERVNGKSSGILRYRYYVFTIVIFEGYRTFGESYVFWKESMPGNLGLTMVRYLYQQAFTYGELGFGSAIGFVLLGIVLLINLAQLKGFGLFQDE